MPGSTLHGSLDLVAVLLSEDEAADGVAGGDDVEAGGGDGEGLAASDGLGIYEDGPVNGVDADGCFRGCHDLDATGDGVDFYVRILYVSD